MDFAGTSYYKTNRTLLSFIGLWVSNTSRLRSVQRLIFYALLVSCIFLQIYDLSKTDIEINYLFHMIPYVTSSAAFVLKYNTFALNFEKMGILFDHVKRDWNSLKNDAELQILKQYAHNGTILGTLIALFTYPTAIVIIINQWLPYVLDIIVPLDEPRPLFIAVPLNHIIQESNFLPIVLYVDIILIIGLTTVVGSEAQFLMFVQHSGAMFKITSYRINVANESISRNSAHNEKISIFRNVIDAIDMHRRAIQFTDSVISTFRMSYFLLLCFAIAAITVNFYRISILITGVTDMTELRETVFFLGAQFGYCFILNYAAQMVIDHSISIFEDIYDTRWYQAPLPVQKIVLFMLQRSMKSLTIVLGGLFKPSYEGFLTISNMTLSYFMFIYSTRA